MLLWIVIQAKNTHGYLNWAGAKTKFSISFPLASMFSFPSQAGAIYPEPLVGALANFLIVNSHNHHRYREMMCVVLRRGGGVLCVEMGFTWTFPRSQDATVQSKSEPISIKF